MRQRAVVLVLAALALVVLSATPGHAQYSPNFATVSTTTAEEGDGFTLTGGYFDPGSNVEVTFNSTPVTLGSLVASEAGTVSGSFAVPVGATIGAHTIQLSGTFEGKGVVVAVAMQVVAEGQVPAAGSAGGGSATSTGGGTSAGALPATGSSNAAWYTAAAALLMLGGALLVGTTRRHRHSVSA